MTPRLFSRPALIGLLALAALAAPGCKSNGNQELLERELRLKDDSIYELQSQLDDDEQRLEACQRENCALKKEAQGNAGAGPGGDASPLSPGGSRRPPAGVDRLPAAPRRPRSDITVPDLPKIDLGTPAPPGDAAPSPPSDSATPGTRASAESPAPPLLSAVGDGSFHKDASPKPIRGRTSTVSLSHDSSVGDPGSNDPLPSMSSAADVKRIAINRLLSGSHSFGSRPGDDGVRVVFTARDAAEQAILAPGTVSVEVLDPEAVGAAARVARWDFSAEETAAHFRTGLAKGYHFDLIWPDHPPAHDRAKMVVRFNTPDGRELEAQQTVHIAAASDAKHWSMISPDPPAPQQWEASTAPLGAQFDPSAAPPHDTADSLRTVTYQSTAPASVADRSAAAATPAVAAPASVAPIARSTRPVWSPYR